jgi:hypothetical protein
LIQVSEPFVRMAHLSVDGVRDVSTWLINFWRLTTERSDVGQVFKILRMSVSSREGEYARAYLETGQDKEQHWQS